MLFRYLVTLGSTVVEAAAPLKKVITALKVGVAAPGILPSKATVAVLATFKVVVAQLLVPAAPSSVITMSLAFKITLEVPLAGVEMFL